MKNKTEEIIENGVKIGEVYIFRGPKFTGYQTGYTAIGVNGKPVGMAQTSLEDAVQLLRAQN